MSRAVATWVVACLAGFVALAGWSFASPPGSSPDDDYHLPSIWCAQGIDQDHCRAVEGDETMRAVPYLVAAGTCFATDFTISGTCQDQFASNGEPELVTDHGNWGRAYPPYFYSFMSLFVATQVPAAVLVMRLVGSVLAISLITGLAVLLPLDDARWPPCRWC